MPNETIPLIKSITPRNFLSFGSDFSGIELKPLNLLIGPNGSGKSNLIEAINLLRNSPADMQKITLKGGGTPEWVWKGQKDDPAELEVVFSKNGSWRQNIRHQFAFRAVSQSFALVDERIENDAPRPMAYGGDVYFFYRYQNGNPVLNTFDKGEISRRLIKDNIDGQRSILAQRRDPDIYPELATIAQNYEKIRIYREWSFGRNAVFREPQKADMPNTRLEEDFSNLGLFLNRIKTKHPEAKRTMLSAIRAIYGGLEDFEIQIEGGSVQVYFTEGDFVIPAQRLSDGTLRFLCLLAILCDPEPPPLICLEEPELGLHHDVIATLADLIKDASKRTQLIVTTHSDFLVDKMTPEDVVVCEKHEGKTTMKRLEEAKLKEWLEKCSLGELWTKGEIGGNRW